VRSIAGLLCGLIFGFGLAISGMTQPVKVLGFLDFMGRWDPTLALVMAGALAVTAAGYAVARVRRHPIFADSHQWPPRRDIDRSLIGGALIFGAGWGLAGLCPGPAVENLVSLSPRVLLFVAAMTLGVVAYDWWHSRSSARAIAAAHAAGADG
jgi:uncharacterized protein